MPSLVLSRAESKASAMAEGRRLARHGKRQRRSRTVGQGVLRILKAGGREVVCTALETPSENGAKGGVELR